MLEANPRASRTVPFASKAIGVNLVEAACRLMAGARLADLDLPAERDARRGVSVKAAVLPFGALPGRRSGARAGDALDRRGDGERAATSRPRSRRPSAPRAGRCRPAARVPLGARRRQGRTRPRSRRRSPELGFELLATARHGAGRSRPPGLVGARGSAKGAGDRRPDPARPLRPRREHAPGRRTRARDGYLIREAALVARVPVHHDDPGRGGRGARDRERPGRDRALAPGAACRRAYALSVVANEAGRAVHAAAGARAARSTPACPGQFFMLEAPGRTLPRPMSLCLAPPGELAFLIDPIGPGTRALCAPRAGRRARRARPARQRLRPRRRAAAARRRRDRDRAAAVPLRDARPAAGDPRLPQRLARGGGRARAERGGRDRADLRHRPAPRRAATCSPAAPSRCSRPSRRLRPDAQLAWEAPMACGYGACYGCVVEIDGQLKRLCVEGPVLRARTPVAASRLSACPKGHTRFRPSSTLVETGLLSMRFGLEKGASLQEGESGGEPAGPQAVNRRLRLRSAPARPRRRVARGQDTGEEGAAQAARSPLAEEHRRHRAEAEVPRRPRSSSSSSSPRRAASVVRAAHDTPVRGIAGGVEFVTAAAGRDGRRQGEAVRPPAGRRLRRTELPASRRRASGAERHRSTRTAAGPRSTRSTRAAGLEHLPRLVPAGGCRHRRSRSSTAASTSGHEDLAGQLQSESADCTTAPPAASPPPPRPTSATTSTAPRSPASRERSTNNGLGIAGVAYSSPLMSVRVLERERFRLVRQRRRDGITWAADHGAKIINVSFGGTGFSATLCDAVTHAISLGAVVVAAAGNSGDPSQERLRRRRSTRPPAPARSASRRPTTTTHSPQSSRTSASRTSSCPPRA